MLKKALQQNSPDFLLSAGSAKSVDLLKETILFLERWRDKIHDQEFQSEVKELLYNLKELL
jgi:hypothetical protein